MATAFRATDGKIVDLSVIVSSASAANGGLEFEPGTVVHANNGSDYIYGKAASATPRYTLQYQIAIATGSLAFAQLTTGLRPATRVVVTNSSFDSGAFGWFQAAGLCTVIANGTISLSGPMWAAASGTFTDASTSADFIYGAQVLSTGSATMQAYIRWPFVGNTAFGTT